jgi:hypothetical protein
MMTLRPANKTVRLLQIFSAKLVLEVFGGGGAIWGFSEAVGLRTDKTVWFWRPCALVIGALFFCRWQLQIVDYLKEESHEKELSIHGVETEALVLKTE